MLRKLAHKRGTQGGGSGVAAGAAREGRPTSLTGDLRSLVFAELGFARKQQRQELGLGLGGRGGEQQQEEARHRTELLNDHGDGFCCHKSKQQATALSAEILRSVLASRPGHGRSTLMRLQLRLPRPTPDHTLRHLIRLL